MFAPSSECMGDFISNSVHILVCISAEKITFLLIKTYLFKRQSYFKTVKCISSLSFDVSFWLVVKKSIRPIKVLS